MGFEGGRSMFLGIVYARRVFVMEFGRGASQELRFVEEDARAADLRSSSQELRFVGIDEWGRGF
jgi:hypothetical protein